MIRVAAILLVIALGLSTYQAGRFIDLWLTQDQLASLQYNNENYVAAGRNFDNLYMQGLSYYAAEDFNNAINALRQLNTAESNFYMGNAYAQMDRLEESLAAYEAALLLQLDFPQAEFNFTWVSGLKELANKEYEDAGGTGGQLEADEIVFDDRADDAVGEMSELELRAQGMSDEEIQDLWMRRVQTTPGDFLKLKFSYQAAQQ